LSASQKDRKGKKPWGRPRGGEKYAGSPAKRRRSYELGPLGGGSTHEKRGPPKRTRAIKIFFPVDLPSNLRTVFVAPSSAQIKVRADASLRKREKSQGNTVTSIPKRRDRGGGRNRGG